MPLPDMPSGPHRLVFVAPHFGFGAAGSERPGERASVGGRAAIAPVAVTPEFFRADAARAIPTAMLGTAERIEVELVELRTAPNFVIPPGTVCVAVARGAVATVTGCTANPDRALMRLADGRMGGSRMELVQPLGQRVRLEIYRMTH